MHRFLAFLRPLRGRTHHFLFLFLRPLRGRTHHLDDDEVPSVLSLDVYGSEEEGGWLLLEAVGATV